MKNFQIKLFVFLSIFFTFPNIGSLQNNLTTELRFEVNRTYPYILITKEALNEANSLADLNKRYESSWVREYISVEILTSYKGKIIKSVSKNDILSKEQKDMMKMSDAGTDVSIKVKYIPENSLTQNDPKELNFSFTFDPEHEAEYPGGQQQLEKYLKEKAIDEIPNNTFKGYDITVVKFTISEDGEVINAHIFGDEYQTSKNEEVEKLLLETIRNMPCWTPAEYTNGIKVKQDFVLTVGNMENCIINLLNIQRNGLPKNG